MDDNMQQSNKDQSITQHNIIIEFFKKNPNRDIKHPEIVDWATVQYKRQTGNVFRDPDRQIRHLHQTGLLIKVAKGIYRYDPNAVKKRELNEFTPSLKQMIFKRDNYRCVICGRGKKEGVDIHADHIKPKEFGGKATLENGQTLCSQHNMMKKTLKQTETGKKMFIRMYELAKKENNKELLKFCSEILEIYEKNNINGHIEWRR